MSNKDVKVEEEDCNFCENLSTYNRGCCSLKLRGIKCSFSPTKGYYAGELNKIKKQLQRKEEELENIKLDRDLWFEHYKQTCGNMAVGDQIWAKRVNNIEQENKRLS